MASLIRGLAMLGIALVASSSVSAANIPGELAISVRADISGAATEKAPRPLLSRSAYSAGLEGEWRYRSWTPLWFGVEAFVQNSSLPDASLFLYRGFSGLSCLVGSGARFPWPGTTGGRRTWEIEVLGGPGLSANIDTGTTLVTLSPVFRFEARLLVPIERGWSWTLGLPVEGILRGGAMTAGAGLSVGLAFVSKGLFK